MHPEVRVERLFEWMEESVSKPRQQASLPQNMTKAFFASDTSNMVGGYDYGSPPQR